MRTDGGAERGLILIAKGGVLISNFAALPNGDLNGIVAISGGE